MLPRRPSPPLVPGVALAVALLPASASADRPAVALGPGGAVRSTFRGLDARDGATIIATVLQTLLNRIDSG